MEVTNRIEYNIDKSAERIDAILSAGNGNYGDSKGIPTRTSLTYTNGYYVNVSAIFIDIVDSSDMTDESKRPVLAKIYRSFISEMTAILNSYSQCEEININGDCVWGVFSTPFQKDINDIFSASAKMNSLIKILNYKLNRKGYKTITVGIGIDYGRALMVKAGYSGSGLNDIIWMGDVVNKACHLSNSAGRNNHNTLLVSEAIYTNLSENNQKLLDEDYVDNEKYYSGDIINAKMDEWYKEHCK